MWNTCHQQSYVEPSLNNGGSSGGGGGGRLELEFDYLDFGDIFLPATIILGNIPAGKSIFKIKLEVLTPFADLEILVKEDVTFTNICSFTKLETSITNEYYTMLDRAFNVTTGIYLQRINSTYSSGTAKIIIYYL